MTDRLVLSVPDPIDVDGVFTLHTDPASWRHHPSLRGLAWNLGYRLAPACWGRGLAQELITAARDAADAVRPDLPVVARLLEHDAGSKRAAERAGLELVWSGPDAGNPDPGAVRLVFADRPLTPDLLAALADT